MLINILSFIIEIIIPVIAIPVFPKIINGCTNGEAFFIGISVSILIAVWKLTVDLTNNKNTNNENTEAIAFKISEINHKTDQIEILLDFQNDIRSLEHPYFQMKINDLLVNSISELKNQNQNLFNGYVETGPYETDTYGVEGMKWTEKELLAVSSVKDYWERNAFVESYLEMQYKLIKEKNVAITRIFIGSKEALKSLNKLMRTQKSKGIRVFYIESDSPSCKEEWKNEDFSIQDGKLLVDLHTDTHMANGQGKEIITIKKDEVNKKKQVFNVLLQNAKEFH